jgi:hypothetical protein
MGPVKSDRESQAHINEIMMHPNAGADKSRDEPMWYLVSIVTCVTAFPLRG